MLQSTLISHSRRSALCTVLALLAGGAALAYDPPEIIGIFNGGRYPLYFGDLFACVGDQNGDGYDDLLLTHNDPNLPDDPWGRVYLFHGGDTMRNQPAFTFRSYEEYLEIGGNILFLGNIQADSPPMVAMESTKRTPGRRVEPRISIYAIGEELSNEPLWTMRGIYHRDNPAHPVMFETYRDHPKDMNGDGFMDFVVERDSGSAPYFHILFGAEDFDTIPDWEVRLWEVDLWRSPVRMSGGFDVNGDGYDDVIAQTLENANLVYFNLYLGGSPPDTVPALRIFAGQYQGPVGRRGLTDEFRMIRDVNDDGYDDWAICWVEYDFNANQEWDGVFVFFGGEEPDDEPDVVLEGSRRDRFPGIYGLTGGDFNGDGIGNITYFNNEGNQYPPALFIHFGNRWFEADGETRNADLYVDISREYNGIYRAFSGQMGAAGDYNGDGVDDFVKQIFNRSVIVFAGSRDWRVSAPQPPQPPSPFQITLSVAPNPFNEIGTIKYLLPSRSPARLSVVDLSGRRVKVLVNSEVEAGAHVATVGGLPSGLYFVLLETPRGRRAQKVVCLR